MNDGMATNDTLSVKECNDKHVQRIKLISTTLSSASGWMQFVAVLSIIGAVLSVINSIYNLLIIWLPIWTAVLLFQAASQASSAALSGNDADLDHALNRLRLYFKISGVVALISLILAFLGLCVAVPLLTSINM